MSDRTVRATLFWSALNVRGSTGVLNVTVTSVSAPLSTGAVGVEDTMAGPERAVEMVNTPRPCAAAARVSWAGLNCRATTGAAGNPWPSCPHVTPPSVVVKTPRSVPT